MLPPRLPVPAGQASKNERPSGEERDALQLIRQPSGMSEVGTRAQVGIDHGIPPADKEAGIARERRTAGRLRVHRGSPLEPEAACREDRRSRRTYAGGRLVVDRRERVRAA